MAKLKIFSFFSGSGFLDLGFETNGFDNRKLAKNLGILIGGQKRGTV